MISAPGAARRRPGRDSVSPGAAPPGLRTDAPARPLPAGAVRPSRKAGGCRSAPEAGFLTAGLAAGEAECWEREEGDGILLNFSTVVSSLFRGEIHLVCPSGRAPRELQQFREVASYMWVSLRRCVSFSLGRFSASPRLSSSLPRPFCFWEILSFFFLFNMRKIYAGGSECRKTKQKNTQQYIFMKPSRPAAPGLIQMFKVIV